MARKPGSRYGAVAKVDNGSQAEGAKADIRRHLVAAIGAERAQVLDCFAGSGRMHAAAWRDCAGYVGCDERFFADDRVAFVANNLRVLRAIDLARFNVFDLDAYGSPWEQVLIIAARRPVRPGELVAFALTEGQGLKLKMGGMAHAMSLITGLQGRLDGLARVQSEVMDLAVAGLARRMRCEVARRWQAEGRTGAKMIYAGLVLRGLGGSAAEQVGRDA